MAVATRNHIHIWKVGTSFSHDTTQYAVLAGSPQDKENVGVTGVRGLTGKLHLHRRKRSGVIVHFRDADPRMLVTHAEYTNLKALAGERCYFYPLDHPADDETHATGTNPPADPSGYPMALLNLDNPVPVDPAHTYWLVTLHILEDTL